MFGKVPASVSSSAGPGPPHQPTVSSSNKSSYIRPATGTTCLSCFSLDEVPSSGQSGASDEKPKSWSPRAKDTIVSCTSSSSGSNCCCTVLAEQVLDRAYPLSTSSSVSEINGASSFAINRSLALANKSASSIKDVTRIHRCSSNPNCPGLSTTTTKTPIGCLSVSPRSQRIIINSSSSNVDSGKLTRKHSVGSRELPSTREQILSSCKSNFRDGQSRNDTSQNAGQSSTRTHLGKETVHDDASSNVDGFVDPSTILATRSSLKSTSRSCPRAEINSSCENSMIPVHCCVERTERGEFVSSTPAKDHHRNLSRTPAELLQQNCIDYVVQDLPTELQSSPRSYKDREKCRDNWRPTEMEGGNLCGLSNACPTESVQEVPSTKRRTGASCQALRHAVASLNRLDDFYMEKIGAGFFSEVYKVTHKVTGQVMVLKMNQLPANRPNMLKEVQLMNKLSHPNILRFMGVCVHEGQLHALTEYINGGSLEQLIMSRHTPLPHLIRMNLARDVSRGMAYLHSRGIFHRDLTSKNVLIKKDESTGEMTAVVGDFGLAAKIPDPSSGYRLSTVGSPYWMSPECLKGQWYDHRSDVFSFGIVVCELIGRVPADPDVLPRSDNFGLDYLAVAEICAAADPPPAFLQLAFDCCTYEPKSRPTFPEITSSLDNMISNYEEESKSRLGNRQSADPTLMSSMDEIVREGRTMKRRTARLRSQSADARGCDNATPSDKARCHSARRVAELASRKDPHYRPMTANPFHALGGVKKILGDLFSSCLELPSLEDVRPSVTDSGGKFKPAQNDSIAKILDRKKPNSEPSSPTARKKWERKVATKVGAASLFAHPLFRDGWEPRRRGSCESGFWSCVGEDLSPEPPNRRHTSTLSSSAASSLFLLDDHRTSSIYTDSSEDIASLGGGDSSCWEDRLSGIGSSSKTISKIVEYFERKQATAGSLRLCDHDSVAPSRMTLLRASLEGPVPLCSISAAQRLVVCEGAVRSKLPLFDKK
ncbi:hypothetical protein KPH14_002084 [Odynerus spinipes]|uniref:dual-specificity kinase n=1 Tax=Odynerus spinipes TaxID=1348599 RepID=A0AAD9RLC2_9HYME|nr:hypothetical protein KPH14_002084 [Odynerus spinipes]